MPQTQKAPLAIMSFLEEVLRNFLASQLTTALDPYSIGTTTLFSGLVELLNAVEIDDTCQAEVAERMAKLHLQAPEVLRNLLRKFTNSEISSDTDVP